ncbi:MAG TPA: TMEM43 family protein, partial [Rhodanobacteraceae bacterium]|nr:TMEM43 family protein [Rhodanobacteraceae bacterium]
RSGLSMAKSTYRSNPVVVVAILAVLVAIGAYAWLRERHAPAAPSAANATKTYGEAPRVSADRIDPANEGRVVTVAGTLSVKKPARDTQLGIDADAVMLLRSAEMLQWQEKCAGSACTYQQVWSPLAIDSRRFREPEGHRNPERLPIASGRFSAGEVALGAFVVDADALADHRLESALPTKPEPYPVKKAELPSNLAASFRTVDGAFYAGDPAHRAVGDLRVGYRIIPAGEVELTGTQRGNRLIVQKSKSNPSS